MSHKIQYFIDYWRDLTHEGNSIENEFVHSIIYNPKELIKEFIEEIERKNLSNKDNKKFFIDSLVKFANLDNLAMWAHYANNHKGIVLEFEKNHWFFNDLTLPEYVEVLHQLEKVIYISRENRKSISSDEYFTKETFLTKSNDWEYEDEYRMSIYIETNDQYIDGIDMKFPNDLLTGVYLGNRVENETKDYILKLLNQDEWKHLNVFHMEIDEIAYKLIPKKLVCNG